MPFVDDAAKNAALDALYGVNASTAMPATFEVALFAGDPRVDGVELDDTMGGYARVACDNDATMWNGAADGIKESAPVEFPDATDAWSDTADWWVIMVDDAPFDCGRLSEPITITGARPGPVVTLTVYFGGFVE